MTPTTIDILNDSISEFCEVRPSSGKGMGLFAKKRIPKGTIWLSGSADQKIVITRKQYENLLKSEQTPDIKDWIKTLCHYSVYDTKLDVLFFFIDNSRYINHSNTPNSYTPAGTYYCEALRDIEPGEEILEDYGTYDFCPWVTLHPDMIINRI